MSGETLWEANIRVIAEKYPGLAEQLGREDPAPYGDIRTEAAAAGEPTLVIDGVYIHSKRDPQREAQRLVEAELRSQGQPSPPRAAPITEPSAMPIIILGFGLGYTAEAAAETGRPLIIVERRRAVLRKSLEARDLCRFLSEHRIIFVLDNERGDGALAGEGVTGALRLLGSSAPALIRNRALLGLDEQWYAEIERHISAWTSKDDVNAATLQRFGKRWVRNLAVNMGAIRDLPGISRLEGILPPDIPVFLAAAGPSLDSMALLLPAIAERCVVVAVDTSLRFLLKGGIEPDFVLVVDPQYWNSRHLDRCAAPGSCLIAESAVYPSVLRGFPRKTGETPPFKRAFLCGSLFPLGRFIEDRLDPKGQLGAGGSVATTAWDFARVLGAASIWIAGLDLSFPRLKTHFKGALFEDRSLAESNRRNPGETWSVRALRDGQPFRAPATDGGQVLTDRRLSLYAAWFESRFRRYPGIRNYSLSPGGLAIPGMMLAKAEELLALPPRRRELKKLLEGAFSRIEADFTRPEAVTERAEHYEGARKSLLDGLKRISEQSRTAAEAAETGIQAAGQGRPDRDRLLKQLDETTRFITESEVKDVAGFLFPPIGEAQEADSDPWLRYLASSKDLYRALGEAAEYHLACLTAESAQGSNAAADKKYNGREIPQV
ncbi:hypothetical protein FACS189444_4250 [Spirochaetia bacterium]|nr:hypothetical protein FACS189444_4250 [Spirochaetia bacterium]